MVLSLLPGQDLILVNLTAIYLLTIFQTVSVHCVHEVWMLSNGCPAFFCIAIISNVSV